MTVIVNSGTRLTVTSGSGLALTSDGTIASRSWTFGDGSTSTATNPSHTYASANTYSVALKVTDNLGATNTKTSPGTVSAGTRARSVLSTGVGDATPAAGGVSDVPCSGPREWRKELRACCVVKR